MTTKTMNNFIFALRHQFIRKYERDYDIEKLETD